VAAGTRPPPIVLNIALIKMPRRPAQLRLSLKATPRWGGARVGAGRKPVKRPVMRHGERERFARPLPTHVTLRVREGVPTLRTVPVVAEIARTFSRGCSRPGFRLVHYSLQGNHAHLIVEAQDQVALACGMKAIGARLARAVNRIAKRTGPVLAERYHHRLLPTPTEVRNALRYVLLNARPHAKKAAATARTAAEHVRFDPASSAEWFDGWKLGNKAVPNATQRSAAVSSPPVARARTWLLTSGWRRLGLRDPAEAPA
jgi:REP element-mobilizing transposase RayT